MASANRKVQIGLSIPLGLLNEIDEIVAENSSSRSSYVVNLIRNGMGKKCESCEENDRMIEFERKSYEEHMKTPFGKAKTLILEFIKKHESETFTMDDIQNLGPEIGNEDIEHALNYYCSWGFIFRPKDSTYHIIRTG
jgi:hypothetical protein